MSAADQPTLQADIQKEQPPVIDVFQNTSLSDMQAAGMRNPASPAGDRQAAGMQHSAPLAGDSQTAGMQRSASLAGDSQTAGMQRSASLAGDSQKAGQFLPSVELVACGNADEKQGDSLSASAAQSSVDHPNTNDQAKTGDQAKANDQTKTNDQTEANDQTKAGDRTKANDQTKAGDRTKANDQTKAGDQTKANDQAKTDDQTKANDQTKDHSGQPAKLSPLAQQMQLMAEEADKNAKARANGEPVADSAGDPAGRPTVAKPENDKEFKYRENQAAQAEAKAAQEGKRVVYHFGATWCPGCQQMKRESWNNQDHKVDDAVKDKGILVDIDVDKPGAAELKNRFNIKLIPATVIVEPGKDGASPRVIDRRGYMSEDSLISWLNKSLK